VTALADRAVETAGLGPIAEARARGDLALVVKLAPALERAPLLALGALGDRIRAEEVGDTVRIFANATPDEGPDVVRAHAVRDEHGCANGVATLRLVASLRITSPRAARIRIDWDDVGLELSQVALGFGASELVGRVATRRGLPIADDEQRRVKGAGSVAFATLKKKELEALIRRTGRIPVFAGLPATSPPTSTSTPTLCPPEAPHA
jgi:hypothetical protein